MTYIRPKTIGEASAVWSQRKTELVALLLLVALLAVCGSPYSSEPCLFCGAREKQLSEDRYLLVASINGFSPPGRLKPLLLKRASELGQVRGYKSFAIERVEVTYDIRGMGYGARGVVRYSAQPLVPQSENVYAISALDTYPPSLESVDTSRLAKLKGSQPRGGGVVDLNFTPVFLDAVAAKGYGHAATSFLEPDNQSFFVHIWLKRTLLGGTRIGFVPIERHLQRAKSYVVTGRYRDGSIEYWLEDESNGTSVGAKELITLDDLLKNTASTREYDVPG